MAQGYSPWPPRIGELIILTPSERAPSKLPLVSSRDRPLTGAHRPQCTVDMRAWAGMSPQGSEGANMSHRHGVITNEPTDLAVLYPHGRYDIIRVANTA